MKKSLFESLTIENQEKIQNFKNIDLMDSLHKNHYFTQLNARDLFMLSDIFDLNKYDISFASAMLQISNLFKS
jgi:hypothetical protein